MYLEMIIIFFKIFHRSAVMAVAWLLKASFVFITQPSKNIFLTGLSNENELAFNHCFCYIDCTKPTFSKFIQIF